MPDQSAMPINADQISEIDPKCGTIKIIAHYCRSMKIDSSLLRRIDLYWGKLILIDQQWSTLGSIPKIWSLLIHIDWHRGLIWHVLIISLSCPILIIGWTGQVVALRSHLPSMDRAQAVMCFNPLCLHKGGVHCQEAKRSHLEAILKLTVHHPFFILQTYLTRVMRKQTLRSLSVSYQKKDGRSWPRPSFFWYDTDFSEFDSTDIIDYILKKSVSYQKKDGHGHARPSFFWRGSDKDRRKDRQKVMYMRQPC